MDIDAWVDADPVVNSINLYQARSSASIKNIFRNCVSFKTSIKDRSIDIWFRSSCNTHISRVG